MVLSLLLLLLSEGKAAFSFMSTNTALDVFHGGHIFDNLSIDSVFIVPCILQEPFQYVHVFRF